MNATWTRIGDLYELSRRRVDVQPTAIYTEIGLRSFGKGIFHKTPIAGVDLGNKRVFYVRPGDLIVSNVFGWEGAIAVAGEGENGLIGSHRFMTWTVRDHIQLDNHYVMHYLISDGGLAQLAKASPGSAGRNKTLGIRAFENIEVPLPKIATQRQIASKISLATSIHPGGIRHRKTIFRALHEQIVDAATEDATTKSVRVGDVVRLSRERIQLDSRSTYRQIGVYSWGKGIIEREAVLGNQLSKLSYYRIPANALLLSNIQAWEAAIAVSQTRHSDFVASQRFLPYVPFDLRVVDPKYLLAFFLSDAGMSLIRKASPGSVTRNRTLGISAFENLTVPLPDMSVQREAVRKFELLSSTERLLEKCRTIIDALPLTIRNEVFSGVSR